MTEKYEFAVIGSGPAGFNAALTLAGLKRNVLLIDRTPSSLGGTCLNRGCIPMKTYLEEAGRGVSDIESILKKASSNIETIKNGLKYTLEKAGVKFAWGEASFLPGNILRISSGGEYREVRAGKYIIAAGSEPSSIPGIPAVTSDFFFSAENITKIPETVAIAGAGYAGCEFASFLDAIGRKVVLIELKDNILPSEDRDVSDFLRKEFARRGIKIMTGTKITGADEKPEGVEITTENAGSFYAGLLLNTAGRKPSAEPALNLEKVSVDCRNGFIELSEKFRTSNPEIFAAGDAIDTPMLAHTASAEGKKAALQAAGRDIRDINYSIVPRVIFSIPQAAGIGITETDAKEKGIDIRVKKNFFKSNPKALIKGETRGFIKLIYDNSAGTILGAAAAGPEATELIHIMSAPLQNKMTIGDFEELIFAHPTLSEIFG